MSHLTNFSFEFFYKIFTEDASQFLLYHGAKKNWWATSANLCVYKSRRKLSLPRTTLRHIDLFWSSILKNLQQFRFIQQQSSPSFSNGPFQHDVLTRNVVLKTIPGRRRTLFKFSSLSAPTKIRNDPDKSEFSRTLLLNAKPARMNVKSFDSCVSTEW